MRLCLSFFFSYAGLFSSQRKLSVYSIYNFYESSSISSEKRNLLPLKNWVVLHLRKYLFSIVSVSSCLWWCNALAETARSSLCVPSQERWEIPGCTSVFLRYSNYSKGKKKSKLLLPAELLRRASIGERASYPVLSIPSQREQSFSDYSSA